MARIGPHCAPYPILSSQGLRAILFLGSHSDGEDLDFGERKTVSRVAKSLGKA
jgi:hypothetical protein